MKYIQTIRYVWQCLCPFPGVVGDEIPRVQQLNNPLCIGKQFIAGDSNFPYNAYTPGDFYVGLMDEVRYYSFSLRWFASTYCFPRISLNVSYNEDKNIFFYLVCLQCYVF